MRRTFLTLLLIAACVPVAACGGDSDDGGGGSGGTVGTTSEKATPTNTGTEATIVMQDISFAPPLMIVKVGTKITWVNNDTVQHDVESTSGPKFHSPLFGKGGTFTITAKKAGAIEYVCTVHPGMKARIQIEK